MGVAADLGVAARLDVGRLAVDRFTAGVPVVDVVAGGAFAAAFFVVLTAFVAVAVGVLAVDRFAVDFVAADFFPAACFAAVVFSAVFFAAVFFSAVFLVEGAAAFFVVAEDAFLVAAVVFAAAFFVDAARFLAGFLSATASTGSGSGRSSDAAIAGKARSMLRRAGEKLATTNVMASPTAIALRALRGGGSEISCSGT
ncbi:MAG: hypothetical protein M3517_10030 [Actinomycetota bacterium]|nr:hypothetical protein [Actinomycetota bacterium]